MVPSGIGFVNLWRELFYQILCLHPKLAKLGTFTVYINIIGNTQDLYYKSNVRVYVLKIDLKFSSLEHKFAHEV